MSEEIFSVLVWFWNDLQTRETMVRVQRVDSGEPIRLKDGSFLLRAYTDADVEVIRCLIRHLGSGHEAHIQGGATLENLLLSSLLDTDGSAKSPGPAKE